MRFIRGLLPALFALLFTGHANAQVGAAGTQIIIPLVASTVSFVSQIVIKDESGTAHSLSLEFYEALTSGTPGKKTCTSVPLGAGETKTVTLAGQCTTLDASNHHGFVILTDTSATKDKVFYAFTRVENPAASGFTVEGYPIGHIGGGDPDSEVAGVKRRTSTNPAIQTNCFVAALDGDIDYSISLDVAGTQTLPAVAETLHAGQMRRYLDIFALAGAPLPDYDDVTVTFSKNNAAQWPNTLIAFCTVQDNTSLGADFRIAKTLEAADPSRARLNCFAASFGVGACTDVLQPSPPSVPDTTTKVRLLTRIYAPDTVNCAVVGPRKNDLKVALVRDFSPGGTLAGGTTNTFTYATGARAAIGGGFHQTYFLDVSFKVGGSAVFPIPFGVQCKSGNGMMDPYFLGTV